MASEAVDKVVNIVEILENVLFHLDTRTLVLAQRTSKTFQNTIKCSPKLLCLDNDTLPLLTAKKPIITPEGYSMSITDRADSGDIEINFIGDFPARDNPATGSWRALQVTSRECAMAFYSEPEQTESGLPGLLGDLLLQLANQQRWRFRSVSLGQGKATLGDIMDRLMEAEPRNSQEYRRRNRRKLFAKLSSEASAERA